MRMATVRLEPVLILVEPGLRMLITLSVRFQSKHSIPLLLKALSNKNMPRTFGDGVIHSSHFDVLVQDDSFPLHIRKINELGEVNTKIGKIIAENLVSDGATLQMGIGGVPDAALAALGGHKDLGIHTEM